MKKTLLLTVGILLMATGAFAQATASAPADATATIIAPLTITKDADLAFGTIAASGAAGTVAVGAGAAPAQTPTGGVSVFGGHSSAAFTVGGAVGYTYNVSVSATATVTDGAGATMTVDTFVPSCATGCGFGTLYVGGTLNVNAGQLAGTYSSANLGGTAFTVTVEYN